MIRRQITPLFLCFALAACAGQASPEDAEMANNLCAQGKVLLATGKYGDARDIYASATHRDENNARAWNGLGASYDLLGKKQEAKDAYEQAIERAPDDLTATNNLAHLDLEIGDPDAAVRLLQPHANDPAAPAALRQNLENAIKAAQTKQEVEGDIYADLGAYPTEGMANGHIGEVRELLGRDARGLTFTVIPEVKTTGGMPTFTLKATGRSPADICGELNPKAFPCLPHGK